MIKKFENFTNYYMKPINKSFHLTMNDVDEILDEWEDIDLTTTERKKLKNQILSIFKNNFYLDDSGLLLGIENFPDTIKLYRLIEAQNESDIDTKNFGCHWTSNRELLYNDNFQFSIALMAESNDNLFIIEAVFRKEQIHPVKTIIAQMEQPEEREITVKEYEEPISYKITKYTDN